MALHIQMSPEAEAELKRAALRNKLSSFAACAAFILFGGGIMFFTAIYIAIEQEAEFITYVAPADDAPPKPTPTTPQLSAKQSSPSNTVAPSVIVANAAAPVAMAQVDVPMDDSTDDGMSLDLGMGLDGGLGDGLGDGGSGMGSSQGGGSALEGTFYDLKQTRNGAPNGTANAQGVVNKDVVIGIINEFIKNWNPNALSKYYQSPTKLYATNFYIPQASAAYAPVAYQCKDKVKPAGWMAVYRGKVKAPKTGKFRFVGTGDDTLVVRFNREVVLDAGYILPGLGKTYKETHVAGKNKGAEDFKRWEAIVKNGTDKLHKGYDFFPHPDTKSWNDELGGLTAGKEFSVKEGSTYPIEILVSEIPGGAFGMVLFIQETTNGKSKDAKTLQLFRTNFSEPDAAELKKLMKGFIWGKEEDFKAPTYSSDSLIWTAVP